MSSRHVLKLSPAEFVLRLMAVTLVCLVAWPSETYGQAIPDPGATDWFYPGIGGSEFKVGQSFIVPVILLNDEAIEGVILDLQLKAPDTNFVTDPSDYVRFDSLTFLRVQDSSGQMLDYRTYVYAGNQTGDGVDTISVAMWCSNPPHVPLPPNFSFVRGVIVSLWFTGVAPGWVDLKIPESTSVKLFPDGTPVGETGYFVPSFDSWESRVYVVDSVEPPEPVLCTDPGMTDYGWLGGSDEGYPLGESVPITFSLSNDDPLTNFGFTVKLQSVDGGSVKYDSLHYVGRMADPDVNALRFVFDGSIWVDGILPDSIGLSTYNVSGAPIPAGIGPIVELFVTGTAQGDVAVSGASGAQAICPDGSRGQSFSISVGPAAIHVGDPVAPAAVFDPIADPAPLVAGEMVSFEVDAASPIGNPVEVSFASLYLYDSLYGESVSQPVFSGGIFTWTPDPADVGIWKATFVATDQVSGRTTEADVVIQVVSDPIYQLSFETVETADALPANGIAHGDYDSDGSQEIVVCGDNWIDYYSVAVYDNLGFGHLQEGYTLAPDGPNRGLVQGYINDDNYLDAITCMIREVWVLLGDGNGGFTVQDANVPRPGGGAFVDAVLTDYNGDAYLDYVCLTAPSLVTIYAGGPGASFSQSHTFNAGTLGLSLASADQNGDGRDDLIVGTYLGLEVYLNNGSGAYELSYSYTCNLGTYDIDITDQGSDFNGDGIYDLCIAAPGIGPNEGLSDLEVHFGQGDGTYNSTSVRMLYGTVCGNRAGDFNGDGKLDIAFINSTERYLGLLFGDETGGFRNQVRYDIPKFQPRRIDCMDIDADGDLDVVVSAFEFNPSELKSSIYVFLNGLNPVSAINAPMQVAAIDNIDIEVIAPNGGSINRVSNSIPSATLYRRNINGNSCLDAEVTSPTISPGRYLLSVAPRPNLPPGQTFSLDYSAADKKPYQIARDLPVPSQKYIFPIYPDGQSGVTPVQGECTQSEHPFFEWDSTGSAPIYKQSSMPFSDVPCEFRLATDPDFASVVESAVVTGHQYVLQTALSVQNPTSYFWQIRPEGQTEWSGIYAFHTAPEDPTDVDDTEQPDEPGTGSLPLAFALRQNSPNPFNPATGISYDLPRGGHVRLEIFNVLGNLVTTLVDEYQGAGQYVVTWDASRYASGMYLYRLTTDEFRETKKMIMLK